MVFETDLETIFDDPIMGQEIAFKNHGKVNGFIDYHAERENFRGKNIEVMSIIFTCMAIEVKDVRVGDLALINDETHEVSAVNIDTLGMAKIQFNADVNAKVVENDSIY